MKTLEAVLPLRKEAAAEPNFAAFGNVGAEFVERKVLLEKGGSRADAPNETTMQIIEEFNTLQFLSEKLQNEGIQKIHALRFLTGPNSARKRLEKPKRFRRRNSSDSRSGKS
ncbi:hypothetical protein L596_016027 [Steinernema carpocapsae]|uniref:Uncharacterized protein n=1 Tax=Steinernema carpocapsae TaxID=34508 RepID=A0A4U5NHZ3_STECR|nr:hypothetical protein L596_016027 [Steinernema carpocapsae]